LTNVETAVGIRVARCFFSNQKYQFGYILEGLGMETVVIVYDNFVHFTAI
jgi:hypothetical protein